MGGGDSRKAPRAPGVRRGLDRRRLAAILVLLVIVAGSGFGGWRLDQAVNVVEAQLVSDLQAGVNELNAGKQQAGQATPSNLTPLTTATAHFEASRKHFTDAAAGARSSRLLAVLGDIPVAGGVFLQPRLRAVLAVADMGAQLADAGESTVAVDAQLLSPGQAGLGAGQRAIGFLQTSPPGLAAIGAHLRRADADAKSVDTSVLPASERPLLRQALSQIETGLAGLAEFTRLAPAMVQILGGRGKRTYLFEQVDPAELRGSGGFIGSYSLLTADSGTLTLGDASDVTPLDEPAPLSGDPGYVQPPDPLATAFLHGWTFGDSNFSPAFATAAKDGEGLLKGRTGSVVDGVISIDPWAVAALLSVTGPLAVPGYDTTVTAATFPEDVFQRLETVAGNTPTKKAFFPAVANLVIEKINALPASEWATLLTALNTAVTQRHLQAYFDDPAAEAQMRAIGWSGPTIGPQAGADETVMEVESNLGGNKANHFLTRTYTLDLTVDGSRLDNVLKVGWKNDLPAGYEGLDRNYTVYLRTYLPAAARDVRVAGLRDNGPVDETPPAATLVAGWVTIPTGDVGGAQVSWSTSARLDDGYTIYWRKQAGTLTDQVHVVLHSGRRVFTATTDLGQDRSIELTSTGIRVRAGTSGSAAIPFAHS